MCCKNRKYLARAINTTLLCAGGFSFGRDFGLWIYGRNMHDILITGFIGAALFFVFSIWMRNTCRCTHKYIR